MTKTKPPRSVALAQAVLAAERDLLMAQARFDGHNWGVLEAHGWHTPDASPDFQITGKDPYFDALLCEAFDEEARRSEKRERRLCQRVGIH